MALATRRMLDLVDNFSLLGTPRAALLRGGRVTVSTTPEPLPILGAAPCVVGIAIAHYCHLLVLLLCRVTMALRSLLAAETLRRLLSGYHVLSDTWQKIGLPAVLDSCAVHFHLKLTALQLLWVYWVLTLRDVVLVVQLRDVRLETFDHLRTPYVIAYHHRLFV